MFHFAGWNRVAPGARVSGPAPDGQSYASFVSFSDPDGNGWLLQEITTRLPGRVDAAETAFASPADLASALRRAEAAHGQHEKRTGERDANWPELVRRVHGSGAGRHRAADMSEWRPTPPPVTLRAFHRRRSPMEDLRAIRRPPGRAYRSSSPRS